MRIFLGRREDEFSLSLSLVSLCKFASKGSLHPVRERFIRILALRLGSSAPRAQLSTAQRIRFGIVHEFHFPPRRNGVAVIFPKTVPSCLTQLCRDRYRQRDNFRDSRCRPPFVREKQGEGRCLIFFPKDQPAQVRQNCRRAIPLPFSARNFRTAMAHSILLITLSRKLHIMAASVTAGGSCRRKATVKHLESTLRLFVHALDDCSKQNCLLETKSRDEY